MLTVIETDFIERENPINKKTTPVCLNALKDVLSETVEVYKKLSLDCNFHELISAGILSLEVCVSQAPDLVLSKEMILDYANDLEKACRRCLDRILFETGPHDLQAESEESGIRLTVLQVINVIRELDLNKESLLAEKNQTEMENIFQSLKPQLTTAFNRIIQNSITSLRFVYRNIPELCLLIKTQSYIGFLVGVVSRITKKEVKELYPD